MMEESHLKRRYDKNNVLYFDIIVYNNFTELPFAIVERSLHACRDWLRFIKMTQIN